MQCRSVQSANLWLATLALAVSIPACASLTIQHVDYAWPVESVLVVGENNTVFDGRHALTFNVAPVAERELKNPDALKGKAIRLLRNGEGYYFLTGEQFKHVYVFLPEAGELRLSAQLEVSQQGLKRPALNQRSPYVELVDGASLRLLMTGDEILEPQDLRAEGR